MVYKNGKEIENPYEHICSGAESLSSEVEQAQGTKNFTKGFEDYIQELNKLQRQYVQRFQEMSSDERTDSYLLLGMLESQIHGRLDILRCKAMRGALRRRTPEKNKQGED